MMRYQILQATFLHLTNFHSVKWMVLEARRFSKQLRSDEKLAHQYIQDEDTNLEDIVQQLNSWGYEDAAKVVYGCTYAEWKSRHQSKATEEQL